MGIQAFKTGEFTVSHHISITSHVDMRGLAALIAHTLGAFIDDVYSATTAAKAHGGSVRRGGVTVNIPSSTALTLECVLDNGHHAAIGVQDVAQSSINTEDGNPRQTLKATVGVTSDPNPNLAIADSDKIFNKLACPDNAADFHVRVETHILRDNGGRILVQVKETEQVPATPDPSNPQTDTGGQVKQYPPRPRITPTKPKKEASDMTSQSPYVRSCKAVDTATDRDLILAVLKEQEALDNQMLDDLISIHAKRKSPATPDLEHLRQAQAAIRSTVSMIGARVDYTVTVSPLAVRAELLNRSVNEIPADADLPAGTVVVRSSGEVAVRNQNGTWSVTGKGQHITFTNILAEGGTIIHVPTAD